MLHLGLFIPLARRQTTDRSFAGDYIVRPIIEMREELIPK